MEPYIEYAESELPPGYYDYAEPVELVDSPPEYSYIPEPVSFAYESPPNEEQYYDGDIIINDDWDGDGEEDEDEEEEVWIPYEVDRPQPTGGNTQQVIIGSLPGTLPSGLFPSPEELNTHWNDLHTGATPVNRTWRDLSLKDGLCVAGNATGELAAQGIGLKHVDLSGLGLALLLLLLVLFGLNIGWDRDSADGSTSAGRSNDNGKSGKDPKDAGRPKGDEAGGERRTAGRGDPSKDPKSGSDGKDPKPSKESRSRDGRTTEDGSPESGSGKTKSGRDGKTGSTEPGRTDPTPRSDGTKRPERGSDGKSTDTSRSERDRQTTGKTSSDRTDPSKAPKDRRDGGSEPKRPDKPPGSDKRPSSDKDKNGKSEVPKTDPSRSDRNKRPEGSQPPREGAPSRLDREKKPGTDPSKTPAASSDRNGRVPGQASRGDPRAEEERKKREDEKKKKMDAERKKVEEERKKVDAENKKKEEEKKKKEAENKARREGEGDPARPSRPTDPRSSEPKPGRDPAPKPDDPNKKDQRTRPSRDGAGGADGTGRDPAAPTDRAPKPERTDRPRTDRSGPAAPDAPTDGRDTRTRPSASGGSSSTRSTEEEGTFLTPTKVLIALLFLIPLLSLLGSSGPRYQTGGIRLPPRHSSRLGNSSRWVATEPPPPPPIPMLQNIINNVHAQGSDIPINIGSGPAMPVPLAPLRETIAEETVRPLDFYLTGPYDPERLFAMLFVAAIVGLPIFIDYLNDWPERKTCNIEYMSDMIHYLILGGFGIMCLWLFDQQFGYVARMRPTVVHIQEGLRYHLSGSIVATAQGAESLVWAAEDALFGDGRDLLGILVGGLAVVFLSQCQVPDPRAARTEYADPALQLLYVLGFAMFALLFWNA